MWCSVGVGGYCRGNLCCGWVCGVGKGGLSVMVG